MKIIWWGRLGKLLQLLSALFILIEIIGATRLRTISFCLFSAFHKMRGRESRITALIYSNFTGVRLFFALVILVTLFRVAEIFDSLSPQASALLKAIGSIPVLPIIIIGIMLTSLAMMGYVTRILANLLGMPKLDRIGKLMALALFLIGFHFDLLSS